MSRGHSGGGDAGVTHPAGLALTRPHVASRTSSESLPAKTCSLFLPSYVQDKYLLHLLHSADDVSTWVAAEIVTCHSSKVSTCAALASEQVWCPVIPPRARGLRPRPRAEPTRSACHPA